MIEYLKFKKKYLKGVISLLQKENWSSYIEDQNKTYSALTAPGVITLIAKHNKEIIGFVQLLTDSNIQSFIPVIIVSKKYREEGIGKKLIEDVFKLSGAKRIDLLTDEDSESFYQKFQHSKLLGYRIYPKK
ncbi:GNAT family N-acetyltransferase [candidate division WOR-3 bacterium]|nr:GNAT family N-acetyltransferase [candidate division WOR-3 bacterium]